MRTELSGEPTPTPILDVLLDRQPYVEASAAAWAAVETATSDGMLAAHAVTTIHHLVRKVNGNVKASRSGGAAIAFPDFEDAVTAAAGP